MKLFQVFFKSCGHEYFVNVICDTFGEAEKLALSYKNCKKVDRVALQDEEVIIKKEK